MPESGRNDLYVVVVRSLWELRLCEFATIWKYLCGRSLKFLSEKDFCGFEITVCKIGDYVLTAIMLP